MGLRELVADEEAAFTGAVARDVAVVLRARADVAVVELRIARHLAAGAVPATILHQIPGEASKHVLDGDGIGVERVTPLGQVALDHALDAGAGLDQFCIFVSPLAAHWLVSLLAADIFVKLGGGGGCPVWRTHWPRYGIGEKEAPGPEVRWEAEMLLVMASREISARLSSGATWRTRVKPSRAAT